MRYAYVPESNAAHDASRLLRSAPFVHPAPERTSRQRWPDDFPAPGPVLKLAEQARGWGWKVIMTYSRGHGQHGTTGKPTALVHLIALKFGLHPRTDDQAYAIYRKPVKGGSWGWSSVYASGPKLPPVALSFTDLREWLDRDGQRTDPSGHGAGHSDPS